MSSILLLMIKMKFLKESTILRPPRAHQQGRQASMPRRETSRKGEKGRGEYKKKKKKKLAESHREEKMTTSPNLK